MYRPLIISLVVLLTVSMIGCDILNTSGDNARFQVLLTDAPGDFERAVVTIDQVYLQADDDGERVVLRDEPVTVDLLELQNEVMDLVEDMVVPAGSYSQLRLIISGGFIEVEEEGGSTRVYASSSDYAEAQNVPRDGALQMPSYAQSGLKVVLPPELTSVEGEQNILLLDFNVAQSFGRQAGHSGMWVMTPVIHATDFQLTGSVSLSLTAADELELSESVALGNFAARLDKGGDVWELTFSDPEDDGTFSVRFDYLVPGTYPIEISSPDGSTFTADVELPLEVTVESGSVSSAEIVITAVSKEE
ncbi:MAG: DUF4382 domain-containing protein [Bacteroidota bacterium]